MLQLGYKTDTSSSTVYSIMSYEQGSSDPPYIINTASGTIFSNNPNGGIKVTNGLITDWDYTGATGTIFPNNSGGGITVADGLITNWNMITTTGTVSYGDLTLTFADGLLVGVT